MPLIMFANGGDQRIVDNLYFINLSRAPFTPRVGVKTSFLVSFVDIQKDKLIAEDLIINIRISKLGGAGTNKGSSGQDPRYLSELASLVQTRGEPRGIEPLMRRHSDEMQASLHFAPR